MIRIRPSRPEEALAQKELWRKAFGDEDRYIDWFYECCWKPEDMLLLLEDGVLASMLALLPMEIALPGGKTASAYYVYALATDPAARKKGYGRQLLHYVDFHLRARGVDCVTVVPAEPSLHKFFATVDFQPGFSLRKLELLRNMVAQPGAGAAQPVEPAEYGRIRDGLLEGLPFIRYGKELIRYQQGMSQMAGAGLYRVEVDGVVGCAAAEYVDAQSLLLKELVIPRPQMAGAVAQLAALLPAARYHVRTPAAWDGLPGSYIQSFGMLKWYSQAKRAAWGQGTHGYMGLGFD